MRKMMFVILLLILFVFAGTTSQSYADDAEVLPKGVYRGNISSTFYLPIDKRFNPDGDVEDAAADFNARLDSSVFNDGDLNLALLETTFIGLGLVPPDFSANIGESVVSFKYYSTALNFLLAYGVTDSLTVGVNIPYSWIKNKVDARLDTTDATVWKNPLYGTPGDPFGSPLIPRSVAESLGYTSDDAELTTDDVQNLLVSGYGYKRIETWSDQGIQDIDVGIKYQFLKKEDLRLAFTSGVRLPVGKVDDTDNLVDRQFGSGAYAIILRLHNDYTGIKDLTLNATLRYDLYLPDRQELRVPEDINQPITPAESKDNTKRDLGDVVELEASGSYTFSQGFNVFLLYKYGFSFKDKISGDTAGLTYDALENESDYSEHIYVTGLSYSTLPLFMEKKFPIPLDASILYRNRFAGTNNVFKSQYVGLSLGVFF